MSSLISLSENRLGNAQNGLHPQEFYQLADVPPEIEWFANIRNLETRRAYQNDVKSFCTFVGISQPDQFRIVTRSHVIAWRDQLENVHYLSASSVRRKLSALSSLFQHLCESNAVLINPVMGVKRPDEGANEGKTPALGDEQARRLLAAPKGNSLKAKRDRAILSLLLYHGFRRMELCKLLVCDVASRSGVMHFKVHGKRDRIRYIPIHPSASGLIEEYLFAAGHQCDDAGALFRPIKNNTSGTLEKALHPDAIYKMVRIYGNKIGLTSEIKQLFGPHAMRTTAATNALEHEADIAKVQEMLGHRNIATTRLYDRRQSRPEDSPVFRIRY